MSPEPLDCRDFVEMVTDLLEGRMSADEVARVEAHLAECPGCAAYLRQMRHTITLMGQVREQDVPPETRNALLAAFRAATRGESP